MSFFESSTPSISLSGGRMTHAVTTGPASGPLPTSSMPATATPFAQYSFSISVMRISFSDGFSLAMACLRCRFFPVRAPRAGFCRL